MHFDDSTEHRLLAHDLRRDICFLYHELAEYSYIMGDLDYGSLYPRPYWDFVSNTGLEWDDDVFIRDGCLVMILAMAWDCIDGSGSHLLPHVADSLDAVDRISVTDTETTRLLATVRNALVAVSDGGSDGKDLLGDSGWVHDTYVKDYFVRTAKQFGKRYYDG